MIKIDRLSGSGLEVMIDKKVSKEHVEEFANKHDIEIDYMLDCPKIDSRQLLMDRKIEEYIAMLEDLIENNPEESRLKDLLEKAKKAK